MSTDRRDFLKAGGLAATSLVIAFTVPAARRGLLAQAAPEAAGRLAPNAYLRIASDDTVTVLLSHSEMGQGIWTALPMLVAEDLDADWSRIRVEHGPAAPEYAHAVFGMQMTGGSSSTWSEFDRYRQAGATARAMLVSAAAKRWDVPESSCRTENGEVVSGERRARYGELVADAARLPAPKRVPLKDRKDWTIVGTSTRRLDSPEKITGRAVFGMDVRFDGLLTALVARPPVFGGSVRGFDAAAALAIPGVRKVVQVPSGVAVVADHFWAAKLGRDALAIDFDDGPNAALDDSAIRDDLRRLASTPGIDAGRKGDAAKAIGSAAKVIEAEYSVPYLAHAPMEPLNCTVRIGDGACEIWTGTQFQTLDQKVAAEITGLKPEQVTIHTTFLGGGFGRRATPTSDFVREAVHVAKAAGAPVKTVWTREDDLRGGYYRPAFHHRARVGLGADGLPVAWHHAIAGQSIAAGSPFEEVMVKGGVDATSVEGVTDSPYLKDVGDRSVELHSPRTGIPVLWWRSVGHSHTAFAMEGLVDELAVAAGADPVEYRRKLLATHPRHLGVLNLAAEKAGWGSAPSAGRARGVAVHESFASWAAHVAEVSVQDGRIRVHRVVVAVDCGTAVNPLGIEAQMQSCVAYGLSAALNPGLTLRGGRVQESNFHDYRVLRLPEMPVVEVHVVPSTEKPGGIGETGLPPLAPAVANAVAALTGVRLRQLPLVLPS